MGEMKKKNEEKHDSNKSHGVEKKSAELTVMAPDAASKGSDRHCSKYNISDKLRCDATGPEFRRLAKSDE